jgi:4,5-dihydroxyphthalate decarboxylase
MSAGGLALSIAVGDYDRTRPLVDGTVQIDGTNPQFMLLEPEEIFFRAFRHAEFDICELSLSSFALKTAQGRNPYVGVPVFLSRAFRHSSIYVRRDRGIASPADLCGRRIGTPEYQLTACVWVRALLEDDYGVKPSDVIWVRAGINEPGRIEKIAVNLPSGIRIEQAPAQTSLNELLLKGAIDAIIAPRAPASFVHGAPNVGWLFSDPVEAATAYFRRTGIFPIMHMLGIRRSLTEQHPWLPFAVMKAFVQAKQTAVDRLLDPSAAKVTLPFVEEQMRAARQLLGEDFWAYGLEPNRKVLETFLHRHHAQGLSGRRLTPEELFHPATLESYRV